MRPELQAPSFTCRDPTSRCTEPLSLVPFNQNFGDMQRKQAWLSPIHPDHELLSHAILTYPSIKPLPSRYRILSGQPEVIDSRLQPISGSWQYLVVGMVGEGKTHRFDLKQPSIDARAASRCPLKTPITVAAAAWTPILTPDSQALFATRQHAHQDDALSSVQYRFVLPIKSEAAYLTISMS
ncbi:hypothetical protein LX32DRAFT_177517 [Colletotrichum zoysiae]|uniref:Uncharacterized protein n=1 Tax=Colletotrichum zoysiae TaxID=1216348 RepID=A0AAD9H6T1_9PEZI|nr:hypothetical protein LX32DRAFT_177517 [Colletotrichum zoysiae]